MAIKLRFNNILKAAKDIQIDSIGGKVKIGEALDPTSFISQAEKNLKDPQYADYINTINDSLADQSLTPIIQSNLKGIIDLNKENIKRAYLSIDSENKARNFTNSLSIPGLSDKQSLRNTRVFVKQSLRHVEHSYKQSFRMYEQTILKN